MYIHEVNLKITAPEAAYKAAMQNKNIFEEYTKAETIGDILTAHWGIYPSNPDDPNVYDCYEDSGKHNSFAKLGCFSGTGEDILDAIAPYVDPNSIILTDSWIITFKHKKTERIGLHPIEKIITKNRNAPQWAIAAACKSVIYAFPGVTNGLQTTDDVEQCLDRITANIRDDLARYLYTEMARNREAGIPPTGLTFKMEGVIQGEELCDYLAAKDEPLNLAIKYKDKNGQSHLLEYDHLKLIFIEDDLCKINMNSIKKSLGLDISKPLPLSVWINEIQSIESIEIKNTGVSRLNIYDFEFFTPGSEVYIPKTEIAKKKYSVKNGEYNAAKENAKDFSRRFSR